MEWLFSASCRSKEKLSSNLSSFNAHPPSLPLPSLPPREYRSRPLPFFAATHFRLTSLHPSSSQLNYRPWSTSSSSSSPGFPSPPPPTSALRLESPPLPLLPPSSATILSLRESDTVFCASSRYEQTHLNAHPISLALLSSTAPLAREPDTTRTSLSEWSLRTSTSASMPLGGESSFRSSLRSVDSHRVRLPPRHQQRLHRLQLQPTQRSGVLYDVALSLVADRSGSRYDLHVYDGLFSHLRLQFAHARQRRDDRQLREQHEATKRSIKESWYVFSSRLRGEGEAVRRKR